jgi:hypothetical protein
MDMTVEQRSAHRFSSIKRKGPRVSLSIARNFGDATPITVNHYGLHLMQT